MIRWGSSPEEPHCTVINCLNGCDEMKTKERRKPRLADILLMVGLALAGAFILLMAFLMGQGGAFAEVRVNGSIYGTYALSEDRTVEIKGEGGNNLLVIKNGKASMSEADCPDKLCVRQGEISLKGQSIICLPHKVVVEIKDNDAGGIHQNSVDMIVK